MQEMQLVKYLRLAGELAQLPNRNCRSKLSCHAIQHNKENDWHFVIDFQSSLALDYSTLAVGEWENGYGWGFSIFGRNAGEKLEFGGSF